MTIARRSVPGADKLVQKEVEKSIASIHKSMCPDIPGAHKYISLPVNGMKITDITVELDRYSNMGDVDWRNGKISGTIYHGGKDIVRLSTDAFGKFAVSNPLHPEIFAGVRKMEAEIVSMVLKMYHGNDDSCGSVTSGGSESIMMSIKAHRDWALDKKGITDPEIIIPVSAHAAFDKGAHYFGVRLIHTPVDPSTGCADIKAIANAISGNTIMIAGSTPSFPHGSIDNIPEMAQLALKHKIGLHVDSCLGGFLIPFMKDAGYNLPFVTDFRVQGVTSISCDTHKYGFAPKGTSVVMYHSKALRKYQYFLQTDWPGGVYGSPTMAGSRPGALSAGCWAVMLYMGYNGYVEATKKIISTARAIRKGFF
jgi:sphinganine-1-phosphate aldolase